MKPIRAVSYVRLSQATSEAESLSVTTQLENLRNFASSNGYDLQQEYVDDGITGWKGVERPAFTRLLADMNAGKFDLIIVRHVDRLARNDQEHALLRFACSKNGVRWQTLGGAITNPAKAEGALVATVEGAIAQYSSAISSERIRMRFAHDRANGRMSAGRRAFGYAEDKVSPHPTEAILLQKAFASILAGGSIFGILSDWNTRGIPTLGKASCWSYPGVRSVLTNARYAGLVTYQGKIQEGTTGNWTPLVTREHFEAVQAILTDPKRRTSPGSKPKYLGGGIFTCAVCGSPMRSNSSQDRTTGAQVMYYRCSAKLAYDGDKTTHATVKVEQADAAVRNALADIHLFEASGQFEKEQDTSTTHAALGRLREARQKLVRLVTADLITEADAAVQLAELKATEAELEKELTNVTSGSIVSGIRDGLWTSGVVSIQKAAEAKKMILERFDALTVDERRELVRAFVTVVIHPGKKDKVQITTK